MDTTMTTTITVDPQSASRLVHIPLEVLLRITYLISTNDLSSVRLTCKALEGSLFNFFSHEFFRKKQFMVSSYSLQALVDIAKHPTLSPCLKHVIIGTDRLQRGAFNVLDDGQRRQADFALADHMNLLVTGGLRDMLAEAFGNLPNLETVDIRDFSAHSRNRDGLGAPWKSYGANTLLKATNTTVMGNPNSHDDPYVTQLFSAVTTALAVAQARPKSIEVLLRAGGWADWGLQDGAFFIAPRMEPLMAQLLTGLQSLHLTLAFQRAQNMKSFIYQNFLSLAPNLTWLRLNFNGTDREGPELLLSWLALNDTERSVDALNMDPIQFSRLERLDLGNVTMHPQALVKLVTKFGPTLTTLSLRRVSLLDDKNDATLKINPWAGFLSRLPKVAANLRLVELSLLSHGTKEGWRGHVGFKTGIDTDTGRPKTEWKCSTRLVPMAKAVAQAIEHMSPEWPVIPDRMDGMYRMLLRMLFQPVLTDF
jgi:hypothetical protein